MAVCCCCNLMSDVQSMTAHSKIHTRLINRQFLLLGMVAVHSLFVGSLDNFRATLY